MNIPHSAFDFLCVSPPTCRCHPSIPDQALGFPVSRTQCGVTCQKSESKSETHHTEIFCLLDNIGIFKLDGADQLLHEDIYKTFMNAGTHFYSIPLDFLRLLGFLCSLSELHSFCEYTGLRHLTSCPLVGHFVSIQESILTVVASAYFKV